MTYDELLAEIDEKIGFWSGGTSKHPEDIAYCEGNLVGWKALRAVVELHKPEPRLDETLIRKKVMVCGHCWFNKITWEQAYRYSYPCPTIQAIEKELM